MLFFANSILYAKKGKFVFSNGDTYEGEYMNSQRNGYGKKKQQTVR